MIGRLLNGVAAIFGAAGAAQFPEFFRQYLQRLGGRLDQTHDDLQRLLADAQTLGRTIESYIEELLASGSEAARQAAARELARLDQADSLQQAYYTLRDATPMERPLEFFRHFDPGIARDTLDAFQPAMPVSPEGFVYAGVGMLLGLLLLAGGERGGRAVGRRVRHRLRRARSADAERAKPRFKLQPAEEDSFGRAGPGLTAEPREPREPRAGGLSARAAPEPPSRAAPKPPSRSAPESSTRSAPKSTAPERSEPRREPSLRLRGETRNG